MSSPVFNIDIGNKAATLISFINCILWCICLSFIIPFQDIYSFFRYLIVQPWRNCNRLFRALGAQYYSESESSSIHEVVNDENMLMSIHDTNIVFERLGLNYKYGGIEKVGSRGSMEINVNVFGEKDPSLDEMKEAFDVFDKNKDGFIDVMELKRVINSIGLMGFSKEDCQRMIMAFDHNFDGRIDFGEFLQVMGN